MRCELYQLQNEGSIENCASLRRGHSRGMIPKSEGSLKALEKERNVLGRRPVLAIRWRTQLVYTRNLKLAQKLQSRKQGAWNAPEEQRAREGAWEGESRQTLLGKKLTSPIWTSPEFLKRSMRVQARRLWQDLTTHPSWRIYNLSLSELLPCTIQPSRLSVISVLFPGPCRVADYRQDVEDAYVQLPLTMNSCTDGMLSSELDLSQGNQRLFSDMTDVHLPRTDHLRQLR